MNAKYIAAMLAAAGLIAFGGCALPKPVHQPLPLGGTAEHGHTYPGATVPFGMVQLSPDTPIQGWDGCSGYHYSDSAIVGFSHTHLSGTGCGCLGDILLMPTVGEIQFKADGYRSRFSHGREHATPGDYRVFLDDPKIAVELTTTAGSRLTIMNGFRLISGSESAILMSTVFDMVEVLNSTATGVASTVIASLALPT